MQLQMSKISTDNCGVPGVTSVDDELFVLLQRDENQVCVYSINDYQLLRHLSVPRYTPDYRSDMTSCVRHKCLYMSDPDNSCILRYELASSATTEWSVPGEPRGLSVTPSGSLIVLCVCPDETIKLVEFHADGRQRMRGIKIQCPWHSVQLTTGQFVVCHGECGRGQHRVCIVGDDGKVTRYGGEHGSEKGQLRCPCYLAVDQDSQTIFQIFVADRDNNRVVLLSPTLEFVRYVSEEVSRPQRLYFHQATVRLFVGQQYGDVSVIQL